MSKHCPRCNERKEAEDFSKDNRTRDNLQKWCKVCMNNYKKESRRSPMPTVKGVKLAKKAIDMVEALPDNKYSMAKAYKQVTGNKDSKYLHSNTNAFWDAVADDKVALDYFRRYLTNDMRDINLQSAFTTYFQEAMSGGSLGEKNAALNLTFKVLGWLEKSRITTEAPKKKTQEDRLKERAEFLQQMEKENQPN